MAKLILGVNDLATIHPDLAKQWHPNKNGNLTPKDVTAGSHQEIWWYLPYDVPMDYPIECLRGKHFEFEWQSIVADRAAGVGCPYLSGQAVWLGFNDLTTTHPDLAKEWHPNKNGDLAPDKVTAGSGLKVWWIHPYDVPNNYPVEHLRGKHFNFEWKTVVGDRVKRYNCPYLSGKAVWPGFNDLTTTYPDLAKEWHHTKNGTLRPTDVTAGSNKKVWWLLSYDVPMDYPVESLRGRHFDFEWEATVCDRVAGNSCPYLSGQSVWRGFNDLATTHPDLAKEWHPTKNGNLTPVDISAGHNGFCWWYLPYDTPMDYPVKHLRGKHFNFEWKALVINRTLNNQGCPFLAKTNGKIWQGYNDLATTHPDLAKEWHPTKNGTLKPTDVTAGSDKKVWWLLSYDVPMDYSVELLRGRHFDFEWEATVANRNKGNGCPYLSGQIVWQGFNDLATVNPKLAKEWHPTKNGFLKPTDVTAGSNQKIWWLYQYNVPVDYPIASLRSKHFDFEWEATINKRTKDNGCPHLSQSNSELFICLHLMDIGINFEIQKRFAETGRCRFDFYLSDYNIIIEPDGWQHFKTDGRTTEQELKRTIQNDNLKNNYCLNNNIPILRIPPIYIPGKHADKIEHMVMDFIQAKQVPEKIINFYQRYDFSNYVEIATELNERFREGLEYDEI